MALVGILGAIYGLAVLVVRPHIPDPATTPYSRKQGASLTKSAGMEIRYHRGDEVHVVAPQTVLHAGDRLEMVVKGDGPRYLEVRMRDGAAAPKTIFPAGVAREMSLVTPGEKLPVTPVLGPGGGKLVLTALFSIRPRPVGLPADPDTQAITVIVSKR